MIEPYSILKLNITNIAKLIAIATLITIYS